MASLWLSPVSTAAAAANWASLSAAILSATIRRASVAPARRRPQPHEPQRDHALRVQAELRGLEGEGEPCVEHSIVLRCATCAKLPTFQENGSRDVVTACRAGPGSKE